MRQPVARSAHRTVLLIAVAAMATGAGIAACGFEVAGSGVGPGSDGAVNDVGDCAPSGCATTDANGSIDASGGGGTDAHGTTTDAATDGGIVALDAPTPLDAAIDGPPTNTPCGGVTQLCCTVGPACGPGGECNNGVCASCGNLFESCCDPGGHCNSLTACVNGTCVGL